MPFQVVGPGETSVADLASEGSLPGVLSHVCLQVVLQVEPTATDVAHEGPLLCVCFNVSLQFRPGLEGQITSRALELLLRMRSLMVLQALSIWKADFTLSAAVVGK